MSRIIKFFQTHFCETIIFLVVLILCLSNFTPNTFLTGWDNLMPELNIWANLKRSIFSVWQEYQGLGLLAGMAHAADLPRQLIILPFTLFLPTNLIRYLWHFSMLFWGTFGLFHLVYYFTKNKYSSLIAALFYLLNFGTVQYFFLPFEPYSTFWGFFPWLIYSLFLFLEKPSLSSTRKFILLNFLAIPSFYVQTIFVVYLICISLILVVFFIKRDNQFFGAESSEVNTEGREHRKNSIVEAIKILLIIFFINAFWLLPNIYFTLTNISVTQNSLQNLMVTDQFVEENLYRGNLQSFISLQGQYYDIKQSLNGVSQPIMSIWHQYFSHPIITIISAIFFLLSLLSIFSKNKYKKYFLLLLFFGLIGFLCNTIPFNFINSLFRQVPLLNQIFRNSFTKLLVPTVFSLSVLLGISLSRLKKINLILIPLLIILSWPSFTGNFISRQVRVNIPPEYLNLFQYLKTQDTSKRIIDLPQYNYWGWSDYQWGFTGSGFLWYGIDQPITSRTFDVWDNHLENFYWQLHYALISRNSTYFQSILTKYNISYILYDPSLFFSESYNSGKVLLENQKLLDEIPNLKLEKQFGNLKLYSVTPQKNNIVDFSSLPNLDIPNNFTYLDQAFLTYGHYQNNSQINFDDSFPYSNLFSNHPDQNSYSPSIPGLNSSWQPCTTTSASNKISAQNQETINFYNCGDTLNLSQGYLIRVNSQNILGRPLLIKIFSLNDHRLIIDSRFNPQQKINYFFIPPIYPFDTGLGINFSSLSLSQNYSVNQINQVEISPFDWQNVSGLHFQTPPLPSSPESVTFHQYNQTFYTATLNDNHQSQLVLFQSFSPGWTAFYFDNFKIKFLPHHQIDNWANGWLVSPELSSKGGNIPIYIIFWPQILEFLGFGLLLIPTAILLKPSSKKSHIHKPTSDSSL